MGYCSKVVRKVGIDDIRVTVIEMIMHFEHRLLGIAARTVGILLVRQIGFEDRFQQKHCCRHAYAIS
jgi:hypothetical protein